MVGAKEFAINRKVIARKKPNPLIERIRMPSFMREHEKELKKMPMDTAISPRVGLPKFPEKDERPEENHFSPRIAKPYDAKTTNPIVAESKKDIVRPHLPFMHAPKAKPKEKEKEEYTQEDISDELANRITYKVLRNIRSYLSRDKEQPMDSRPGGKHIKLEISL